MALFHQVAFDAPLSSPDGAGGVETDWSAAEDAYSCRAEFIYQRGSEAIEAARLSGRAIIKVKIRQSADARGITTDWRMRDVVNGVVYNIIEVDGGTDRQWIWIVAERGVAV
jgi:hypothetical protein